MPEVYINNQGQRVSVDSQQQAEAAKAKGFAPENAEKTVISPAGNRVVIPSDSTLNHSTALSLDERANLKNQQELQANFGGTAEQIRTGAEGILSGATLGLSDIAGNLLGSDQAQRAEANPTTRFAGELAGAVGGSLVGGFTPAGIASKFAKGIGAKAATKAGGILAEGAIEGALFGAGQAVTNLSIRDIPLTAESVVSEIGLNTILGAGTGLFAGGVSIGLGKIGGKVANKAEKIATKTNLIEKDIQKTVSKSLSDVVSLADEVSLSAKKLTKPVVETLDNSALSNSVGFLDYSAKEAIARARGAHLDIIEKVVNSKKALSKATTEAAIKKGLSGYLKAINELSGKVGEKRLGKQVIDVAIKTANEVPEGLTEAIAKFSSLEKQVKRSKLTDVFSAMEKSSPEEIFRKNKVLTDYLESAKELDSFTNTGFSSKLDDALSEINAKAQEVAGRSASKTDLASAALALGIEESIIPDLPGPIDDVIKVILAAKIGAKHGGFVNKLVRGVGRRGTRRLIKSPGFGGAAKEVLAEGLVSKVLESAIDGSKKANLTLRKVNEKVTRSLGKMLKSTGKSTRKYRSVVTKDVLTRFQLEEKPKKNESEIQAFKRISSELSSLAINPVDRLHNNLLPIRQINPELGDAVYGIADNAIKFLQSKLPKDPGLLKEFGISKWRPSHEELLKFARYVKAAKDPTSVVEDLANKRLTREGAETLRVLYGNMYSKMQQYVLDNLPQVQKLDYHYRVQLSTFLNIPADPTMESSANWQKTFVNSPEAKLTPNPGVEMTFAQQLLE